MSDAVTEFFDAIGPSRHEPLMKKATGSLRFDITDGKTTQRWLLGVKKGDITVSRRNAAADLVLRSDRSTFERVLSGDANPMATVLRGEMTIDGDTELLVLFQRLLPRPHDAREKGVATGDARRKS